eukprot:gene4511-8967_t
MYEESRPVDASAGSDVITNETNRLHLLECRIMAMESLLNDSVSRAKLCVRKMSIHRSIFKMVPSDYYDRSLESRAQLLGCNTDQLCKSIIFENIACDHNNISDYTSSRYYCIIIQYIEKFDAEKLKDFVHELRPAGDRIPKKKINFQLASGEQSFLLTGFSHNAISPYGMIERIPIIVAKSCLTMSVPYLWCGGGHPDVKLGLPLQEFLSSSHALIADISVPR